MTVREIVPEGHPDAVAAREVSTKMIELLNSQPNRVIVLAMVRMVCNVVSSIYEDYDDRVAYAEEFFDAVIETLEYNRALN